MYYICKFSSSWSIYDENTGNSRTIQAEELTALKQVFPTLFQSQDILLAIQVNMISPNKLNQLKMTRAAPAEKSMAPTR